MKNKKTSGIATLFLVSLSLLTNIAGWDAFLNNATDTKQPEISKIDGQPIVSLDADGLFSSDYFDHFRDHLATDYGSAIVQAINRKISSADMGTSLTIAAKDLNRFAADIQGEGSLPEIGSTHIRITDKDGEVENFLLTLRPYYQSANQRMAAMNVRTAAMNIETTWLALSPDRFYLHDDENGNEMWPVTFPAVSMEDSTKKIILTFNKDGFVSSSIGSGASNADVSADTQPNIVFMEATPIITPNYVEPCYECSGGGGGSGGSSFFCSEVGGRGEAVGGPTSGTQTYFAIELIRLVDTGDGDGYSELQMFVKNDDNYDGECFSRSYKYRFDHNNSYGGSYDGATVRGADGRDYRVPDVNHEDFNYSNWKVWYDDNFIYREYFPLIDLTNNPGPWRLAVIDTDRDYTDFSRRRSSDPKVTDIWTYDMADGNWKLTTTGFSSDSHHYGSSDDPLPKSGVRRITIINAINRSGTDGKIDAVKYYGTSGSFRYIFSLREL